MIASSLTCTGTRKKIGISIVSAQRNQTIPDISYMFVYHDIIIAFEKDITVGSDGKYLSETCIPAGSYIWRLKSLYNRLFADLRFSPTRSGNWPEGTFIRLLFEDEFIIEKRIVNTTQYDISIQCTLISPLSHGTSPSPHDDQQELQLVLRLRNERDQFRMAIKHISSRSASVQ